MVDCDGCVADFVKGYTTLARQWLPNGERIPVTTTLEQPRWDGFPGMDQWDIDQTWAQINQSKSFWSDLEPMVSKSTFKRLDTLQQDADVYFTTNRRGLNALKQTTDWLEWHYIYQPHVVCVERKGELARAIGADYMIDDKAGNAIYAAYHCTPKLQSFILDRKYNQFDSEVVGSKVTRIKTFDEYLEVICRSL